LLLSEDWLFDDDVMTVDGLRITVPNRSVTFETRRARTLLRAVQAIDMAAYDDLIDLEDLSTYVDRLVARQGIKLTRRAVPLARENVWSPQETTMRLTWEASETCASGGPAIPARPRQGSGVPPSRHRGGDHGVG